MSFLVTAGKRGPGFFRAGVRLILGCALLGGCSAGSDRFSTFSFGSGYEAGPAVKTALAPAAGSTNYGRPVQTASYRPQARSGVQLASATPSQSGGYLQVSRVDLPPLQQRPQGSRGTKYADGYGPYNRPPVADGVYTGPRVYTPYDQPQDAPPPPPPPPSYGYDRGEAPRYGHNGDRYTPPPPPPAYYRDSGNGTVYVPENHARVYEPEPQRGYREEHAPHHWRNEGYGRAPEREAYYEPRKDIAAPSSTEIKRPTDPVASDRGECKTVTVQRGDTLYSLARRYGVTVDMIMRANALSSFHVRPGTDLLIPRAGPAAYSQAQTGAPAAAANQPQQQAVANAGRREAAPAVQRSGEPALAPSAPAEKASKFAALQAPGTLNPAPEVKTAGAKPALEPSCEAALANPAPRMGNNFRKPVEGKTIAQYGPQRDGTVNEGITISVPKGTPVKAAENGVVAYVGDELPGFGNLILIRHADEYVTAYAHADTILVKKCDLVKRGQTVATAGTTGDVSQPELHFEIRKNSKPVDPAPLMGS